MITTSRLLPAAILLLIPAAAASCDQPTNTLPIENFPDAVAWKKNLTGEAKPAIVAISSMPTPEGTVRLLLVNPTDRPIEYGGYTVDSWAEAPPIGQVSPLYAREKRTAEGEWKEDFLGWCGTGADTMVVPPGHAGEFSAHVSTEGQSRVGFSITETSATGTTISELWSPPLGTAVEEVSSKEDGAAAEEPKAEPVARGVEGASKEPNTLPIDGVPRAAAWRKNVVGEAGPAIIVSSTNPAEETDPAQLDVRLLLVNPTDQPIEYSGYTIDSWTEPSAVGQINPRYRKETMSDAGEWKDEPIYWCKFGSARIVVPPGHAGEFDARVPANSKTRIGVNLMPTPENGLTITELWSPTLGTAVEEVSLKDEKASNDEPTNALPIERFPVAVAWKQNLIGDPRVAIIVASPQPGEAGVAGVAFRFLLVNPTERPIEYHAYTVDSRSEPPPAGQIHPLYRSESMNRAGEWVASPIALRGAVKGTMRVPPGHAGEFVAHVPQSAKSRVGFVVNWPGPTGPEYLTLFSPAVGPGSEEVPAKAP